MNKLSNAATRPAVLATPKDALLENYRRNPGNWRPSQSEIFKKMSEIILKCEGYEGFPRFPLEIAVIVDERGQKRLLQVLHHEVVRNVSEQMLVDAIVTYGRDNSSELPNLHLTPKQAVEAKNYVLSVAGPLEKEPALVRFLSEKGFTYHRLWFDHKSLWSARGLPLVGRNWIAHVKFFSILYAPSAYF